MEGKNRTRGRAWLAAMAAALLVASGCGSSRSTDELDAQAARESQATDTGAVPAPSLGGETETTIAPDAGAAVTPDPAAAPGAGGSAIASPATTAPKGVAAAAPKKPGAASAASPAGGPSAAPTGGSGGAAPAPTPGPAPARPGGPAAPVAGAKAEIVLGSIGTQSGLMGELMLPVFQGARVWAADVNARGGVNGHPVKLLMADDGGDPARALSLARRMVEQDKAVAMFMTHGPATGQAIAPYLEQRRVPVIGSCSCELPSSKSPMWFTVGPSTISGLAWAQTLPLLALSKERDVSIMYCREAPGCRAARDVVHQAAAKIKLNIVHDAEVSLAAPDYTAEVLAARNAGAKAIISFVDNFSVVRLARSAHRQNWKPIISAQYSVHDERFLKQGSKEDIEGVLIGGSQLHWESPKLADYRSALARHVSAGIRSSYTVQSYVTGKLIEHIGKSLPDQPTSADFLKGLYSLKNETLGGLIPPLTFGPGDHDTTNLCAIPLRIVDGKFVPKDGDNYTCAPA